MVAAKQLATEPLRQQLPPSISSRTTLSVSAEIVGNIMQSISISAARSPATKAQHVVSSSKVTSNTSLPPAAPIVAKLFKTPQCATGGQNVSKVHNDLSDTVSSLNLQPIPRQELIKSVDSNAKNTQPAISIEVLKPGVYTGSSVYTEEISLLANQVQTGLQARVAPIPIDDCTGGVYYLRTKNRRLTAVFKPADEEPYALNNPKSFQKPEQAPSVSGIRQGIAPEDAAVREAVAYLLDHQHFAKVPTTMLASLYHPAFHYHASESLHRKIGSVQAYVPHQDTADDVGVSMFRASDVQAIAMLDIRLANQDRHGGNILVVEPTALVSSTSGTMTKAQTGKQVSLIPIDHGACLPRVSALSETCFLWLFWPQAKQPFSRAALEYIAALDAHHDLQLLEANLPSGHHLEREAALTLHVCTALLKFCSLDLKMTAHDIGMLMCRDEIVSQKDLSPSVLEMMVASTLIDAAVLKSEVLLRLEDKQRGMQAVAFNKQTQAQGKAWSNYVAIFMQTFRRMLASNLTAK
ncbi:hypothetical protein BBO99_00007172 [Phytophthora kernoviae]|uniref:PI3K/PI4K catalytic domain-containing protein n=1 Tax=Phytophthora kernoviae TaxID=325452 RepID=A0A3R7JR84_9STRA|nr:hypothetical protein JM16_006742 [Phytophthora kernoviae]KAG2521438.1 hypothetical protein JM18_006605 [Phytophthora kernoviae]RLN25760.1 hypothetical protein BBI17_007130 [Phytophthora kernoviae]RLN76923.1 hypothetical protein BBO99_00007172 [Phytophthora kernoviae]